MTNSLELLKHSGFSNVIKFPYAHECFTAKWVRVNGTMYKEPFGVLLGVTDSILPNFGALRKFSLIEKSICGKSVAWALFYSEHYNAYVMKLLVTISHRDLHSFMHLHAEGRTASSQRAIILKDIMCLLYKFTIQTHVYHFINGSNNSWKLSSELATVQVKIVTPTDEGRSEFSHFWTPCVCSTTGGHLLYNCHKH